MRVLGCVFALCFAIATVASAQQEYGKPEEMKGLTKLYIEVGTDADLRQIMVRVLNKRLPVVEVLDRPDAAQLVLVFTFHGGYVGQLVAATPKGDHLRILATYRHDETELNDLADEIIKKFIKHYKTINRL